MALIDVVIVNWNSGALLRECLIALAGSDAAERINVIIVDNASSDHSADDLAFPPLALSVVRNPTNRGFGAASNQGAAAGSASYILFLNPDVRVNHETLGRALAYLDDPAHTGIGVVGARLEDSNGQTSRSCARRPTAAMLLLRTLFVDRVLPGLVPPHFLVEWDHADTRPVDQVMGAFLMIRRALFDRLGGFDERFFVYYEDIDLCLRVAAEGYGVVHVAESVAMHRGGGTTDAIKDRRFCYEAVSRVKFAAKHHGRSCALLLTLLIAVVEVPLRIVRGAFTGGPQAVLLALRGGAMFWAAAPRLAFSVVSRS